MHKYIIKSSNNKNLELSFAQSEARQEILKFHTFSVATQGQVTDLSQLEVCTALYITICIIHFFF